MGEHSPNWSREASVSECEQLEGTECVSLVHNHRAFRNLYRWNSILRHFLKNSLLISLVATSKRDTKDTADGTWSLGWWLRGRNYRVTPPADSSLGSHASTHSARWAIGSWDVVQQCSAGDMRGVPNYQWISNGDMVFPLNLRSKEGVVGRSKIRSKEKQDPHIFASVCQCWNPPILYWCSFAFQRARGKFPGISCATLFISTVCITIICWIRHAFQQTAPGGFGKATLGCSQGRSWWNVE